MVTSKKDERLARIQKSLVTADKADVASTLYALIWGRVKSGKTSFIATAESPAIFLAEPGHMTIRKAKHVTLFPLDEKGRWSPPRWDHAQDFLYYLRHGDHNHDAVGMDSMSGLINIGKRMILKDEEARDELRPPDTMTQPTWGRLNGLILSYLEELEEVCQTRGMHLILTAHERRPGDDDVEMEGEIVPDMTPGMRRDILKRPAIIAKTFVEEDEEDEDKLRYGMIFRDEELMVGERVTPQGSAKPWLPRQAYDVTIPGLVRRINRRASTTKKQEE